MNQIDKERLLNSAKLMSNIGMAIFYIAAMFAFFLAGSIAGDAMHTGEFSVFACIACVIMTISIIGAPFLLIAIVKYNKYRKLLNKDA